MVTKPLFIPTLIASVGCAAAVVPKEEWRPFKILGDAMEPMDPVTQMDSVEDLGRGR